MIVDVLDEVGAETEAELRTSYGSTSVVYVHADVRSDVEMRGTLVQSVKCYHGAHTKSHSIHISRIIT